MKNIKLTYFPLFFLLYYNFCFSQKESTIRIIDSSYYELIIYDTINHQKVLEGRILKNDTSGYFNGYCVHFKNGLISSEEYLENGEHTRNVIYYYPNQNIRFISQYINDSTIINKEFYENGNIKSIVKAENLAKNGTSYYYYDNGILESTGNYKYVKVTKKNELELLNKYGSIFNDVVSYKDALWRYYDREGRLLKDELWNNQEIIKIINY